MNNITSVSYTHLIEERGDLLPKSELQEAITYLRNEWNAVVDIFNYGDTYLDNNMVGVSRGHYNMMLLAGIMEILSATIKEMRPDDNVVLDYIRDNYQVDMKLAWQAEGSEYNNKLSLNIAALAVLILFGCHNPSMFNQSTLVLGLMASHCESI